MASSGTIINDFATGYRLQIVWNVDSQSVSGNYANVSATVQLVSLGYTISSSANKSVSQSIDGQGFSGTCTVGLTAYQTKNLLTANCNISHNPDGTKTCSFSASVAMNVTLSGTYYGTVSVSGAGTFDPIARSSQPSLSSSPTNMGTALTIYTNRASTSFTHTIRYGFGNASETIATGVTDSYSWTPPLTLANQVPSAVQGIGAVYLDTYNGGTLIGTKSCDLLLNVPSTVVPSFTSITGSELTANVNTIVGKYVQKLSNIRLVINGATGVYGSTITNYKINYNGADYNANTIDTGVIGWSGTLTVTATITDSRGRTAVKTLDINALAYGTPAVTSLILERCNSDGTLNDMGTYVKVTTVGSVSSLLNGTEKNTLTYTLYSKLRTTQTWTTKKTATTISGLSLNVSNILSVYDAATSFDFRLDITDKFNTTLSLNVLPTGEVTMSWGTGGVGFGKVWEQGAVDAGGDIYENGTKLSDKYDLTPAGSIQMFAASTAPTGWLLCQGQAVSRTTYSRLFAIIGTTYGTGDGSTTFNLPNLKGKVPVGYDSGQTEFNALNKTGGEKTHTLTIPEMPTHTHIQDAHSHTTPGTGHSEMQSDVFGHTTGGSWYFNSMASGTNNTTATNQNTGGGGAHQNLQPYIVLNYIIKI